MSPYRTPEGLLTERGKQRLWTFVFRTGISLLGAIGTAGVLILVSQAKQSGHDFVANSPSTVAIVKAAAEAAVEAHQVREDLTATKVMANSANEKSDQNVAMSRTILEAMNAIHEDIGSLKTGLATSNATLTVEVSGITQRLKRIEQKQDRIP